MITTNITAEKLKAPKLTNQMKSFGLELMGLYISKASIENRIKRGRHSTSGKRVGNALINANNAIGKLEYKMIMFAHSIPELTSILLKQVNVLKKTGQLRYINAKFNTAQMANQLTSLRVSIKNLKERLTKETIKLNTKPVVKEKMPNQHSDLAAIKKTLQALQNKLLPTSDKKSKTK